jgi:hypothetical protein
MSEAPRRPNLSERIVAEWRKAVASSLLSLSGVVLILAAGMAGYVEGRKHGEEQVAETLTNVSRERGPRLEARMCEVFSSARDGFWHDLTAFVFGAYGRDTTGALVKDNPLCESAPGSLPGPPRKPAECGDCIDL